MSEHEVWNELGNLYFLSGMLEQAAYAYNRSIGLQPQYGMPYCNLAYIRLQQGQPEEAVGLYTQSIELLESDHDKAVSWYRLGDAFRLIKNYRDAIMAYQQADALDAEVSKSIEDGNVFLYGPSNLAADMLPILEEQVSRREVAMEPDVEAGNESAIPLNNPAQPVAAEEHDAEIKSRESLQPSADIIQPTDNMDAPEEESKIAAEMEAATDKDLPVEPPELPYDDLPLLAVETVDEIVYEMDSREPIQFEEAKALPAGYLNSISVERENARPVFYSESMVNPGSAVVKEAASDTEVMVCPPSEVGFFFLPVDEGQTTAMADPEEDEKIVENDRSVDLPHDAMDSVYDQILDLEGEIQRAPQDASKWDELAGLYKRAKRFNDALLATQQAVNLNSESPTYLHNLGVIFAVVGRHEEAMQCMQRVIELCPSHSLAHASLGGYFRKMGLEELANQHIGMAMKNYIDEESQYNRACLEALCGNVDQAVEYLRAALDNKQIYVEWVLRDPDLDGIRFTPQFKDLLAEFAQ